MTDDLQKRLALFPEQNPNPVFELDAERRITYLNPAAKRLFPGLEEQGVSHPLFNGLNWNLESDAGRNAQQIELNGAHYELRFDSMPSDDHTRIFLSDVTARVEAERMKEQFIHNVTHELRTPLTSIDQSVKLIIDGVLGECPPKQKRFLEIANRGTAHLRAMINDLLDMTRADTGKLTVDPRRTVLEPLIQEVLSSLRITADQKGVELSAHVSPNLPPVHADPVRVRQILINLTDNGLKFVQAEGRISIHAEMAPGSGDEIQISVSDTGVGIPDEDLKSIFDRLFQVKSNQDKASRRGLGLGLYISKELVNRHGGKIWVTSQVGKGSNFIFTLPAFSLQRIIQPIQIDNGQSSSKISLITTELYPAKNFLTDHAVRSLILESRDTLKHCISHGDVVLPEMAEPGNEGLVFAVVRGGEEVSEAVAKDIVERLRKSHLVNANKLSPVVLYETISKLDPAAPEASLADAASKITGLVQTSLSARKEAAN